MAFTIATFNVRSLIGPEKVYFPFESLTPAADAWKADQLPTMDADIARHR